MNDGLRIDAGGGILGLLGVLFVGLKLTHFIDWSWWWVTCPFWAGAALALSFLTGMGVVLFIIGLLGRFK